MQRSPPPGKLLIGGWNFLLGVTRVLLLLLLRTRRRRRRRSHRRRGAAFRSFGALTKFFSLHYRFHHVWVRRILREARVVSALYFFIIFLSFPLLAFSFDVVCVFCLPRDYSATKSGGVLTSGKCYFPLYLLLSSSKWNAQHPD